MKPLKQKIGSKKQLPPDAEFITQQLIKAAESMTTNDYTIPFGLFQTELVTANADTVRRLYAIKPAIKRLFEYDFMGK